MQSNGDAPEVDLEYSLDGVSWAPFIVGSTIVTLANVGDKMYLRGDNTQFATGSTSKYNKFVMTGQIAASGNIMSIFDRTMQSTAFSQSYACSSMFYGCTSLTTAPELPATTLRNYCYYQMFYGCTSLTTAPELPATTLRNYCYAAMFYGCTSLNSVNVSFTNFAPSGVSSYTTYWLSNVSASGTFTCPEALSIDTRGVNTVPSGWTIVRK